MSKLIIPVSDRDHSRGPESASLILVEYGDYQCPYCGEAEAKLQVLERMFEGTLKRVFRHFPLSQVHEYALLAAMSAEAAGLQGQFWEMHKMLFDNQSELFPGSFEEFARELDLDMGEFLHAMTGKTLQARIKQDFLGGVRSGVNGTPSVFLNGEKYEGPLDADILMQFIDAA